MTLKELYSYCSHALEFSGNGDFEALCIFEDILNVSKSQIYIDCSEVSQEKISLVEEAIKRRKDGEPLQYILGTWDFYDLTFKVGKGVLIPRPETEALVDFALEKLKNVKNPVVYDLCAGTGCIGLTVAKHRPDATVFLLEKESEALKYLNMNNEMLSLTNTKIIQGDLFNVDVSLFYDADMLLSNPPYIISDEISQLQKEVQLEPITALDGGEDGLDFYRCLASRWSKKVKDGGWIAMECGEEQSKPIIDIFSGIYSENNVIFDFNNIDRIVTFRI